MRHNVKIGKPKMSTMGSFSMKGTLNAASCADMVAEMIGSDGCKFRPFNEEI
jgi:hypothetical protein